MRFSVVLLIGRQRQRHEDFGRFRKIEIFVHHSDYCEILAVKFHRPSYHILIGAEPALPETATENRDLFVPDLFLFRKKGASEERLYTEQFKIICRNANAPHAFRIASAGYVEIPPSVERSL